MPRPNPTTSIRNRFNATEIEAERATEAITLTFQIPTHDGPIRLTKWITTGEECDQLIASLRRLRIQVWGDPDTEPINKRSFT